MSGNNDSSTMFAGGVVAVIVVVGLCVKTLKKILIELGKTFDAFGSMAYSFFNMTVKLAFAVGLVALAAACVVGAVYFTYKYYKMVKRGTEIQKDVATKMEDFLSQVNSIVNGRHQQSESRLRGVEASIKAVHDKQLLMLVPLTPKAEPTLTADSTDSESVALEAGAAAPANVNNPF